MKHRSTTEQRPIPPARMIIISVASALLVVVTLASIRSGFTGSPWAPLARDYQLLGWLLDLVAAMLVVSLLLFGALTLRLACRALVRPALRQTIVYDYNEVLKRPRCDFAPCERCEAKQAELSPDQGGLFDGLFTHADPSAP